MLNDQSSGEISEATPSSTTKGGQQASEERLLLWTNSPSSRETSTRCNSRRDRRNSHHHPRAQILVLSEQPIINPRKSRPMCNVGRVLGWWNFVLTSGEVMIELLVPTRTFRNSHTDHLFDRRRTNTCDSFSGTLNQVKKSTWWEPNFAEFTHCSHFLRSCLICIFRINTMQLSQDVSSIYSVPSFRYRNKTLFLRI